LPRFSLRRTDTCGAAACAIFMPLDDNFERHLLRARSFTDKIS
jgi:hypothetical protein